MNDIKWLVLISVIIIIIVLLIICYILMDRAEESDKKCMNCRKKTYEDMMDIRCKNKRSKHYGTLMDDYQCCECWKGRRGD
jgi:hypothetical protein